MVESMLEKHGKDFPRRTEIEELETVDARKVALENIRVGHDKVNHFVGTDVRNSNKVMIKDNVITGATGEGIYIENIGTNTDNIITGNTVSGMKVSEDSNLEAGIFVRNNKDGYIAITDNTVKDNNLDSGVGFPAARGTNASDGIEVNI